MTSALAVLRTVRPVRLVSIRYRDSGVMMRIWGGCFTMRCRSFWGVSPVRMPILISAGALAARKSADAVQGSV